MTRQLRSARRTALFLVVVLLLAMIVLPLPTPTDAALGPAVIAAIPVNPGAQGVAVNPNTNRVYVAYEGEYSDSGGVAVVDGATNTIISSITLGFLVYGIAVNPNTNRVYVAERNGSQVIVIDGSTNRVMTSITVGQQPWGVAVNPSTNRIYVANEADDTVSVINGSNNSVITTVPVGAAPSGVAVNPSTNRIYVANPYDFSVSVINGSTNSIITTINIDGMPDGVAVNPSTNRIYAAGWFIGGPSDDGSYLDGVAVINGSTNTVVANVSLGDSSSELRWLAVNASSNRVYVTNAGSSSSIKVINGGTNTIATTIPLPDSSVPLGIAVNPTTSRVLVADRWNSSIDSASVDVIQDPLKPPNAPAAITASRVSLDPTSIKLTWRDMSPSTANWSPEFGFNIYEGNTLVASLPANTTTYTVGGLTPGTYHCYVVTSVNPAGESGRYNGGACATLVTGLPNAPSNIKATPLNGTQIKLTWTDASPGSGNEYPEEGFRVYEKDTLLATLPANTTTYTINNLIPGTYHCYVITSYNQWGEAGRGNGGACGKTTGTFPTGQYRIQLTWGSAPRDLDGHLWLPAATPSHIFYADRGAASTFPFTVQDTDDQNGMGPEIISITQLQPGVYTYAVYNYSNERALAGSGASVKIYRGSTLVRTITAPTSGSGRWWNVLTLDSNGTIQTVNTLGDTYPGPY